MLGARFDSLFARDFAPRLRPLALAIATIAACVAVAVADSSALPSRAFGQIPTGEGARETASNTPPRAASVADLEMMPRASRRAREASLVALLAARSQVEADLRALQAELQSDAARGRETELERKIQARVADLAGLSRSFSELATGVDPLSLDADPEPTQFELARELRVLLSPLINELKRATSRPREIDRLRTEIADLDDQMKTIDKALERLDAVSAASKDAALGKALASERKDWARRRSAIEATLEVTQQKLDQRAADSQSIAETIRSVFQGFFKSRGRNLLFSVIATVGFLIILLRIRTFLGNRRSLSQHSLTFRGRVFGLAYSVFTVVGTLVVFIAALYFFGDWVLLIIALLLILGLVWASKQALPRFWSQAVLILDMGAVREGQRVIWNGLA